MIDRSATCQNCLQRHVSKPRGLCYSCFRDLAIRVLYQSTHPCAVRGIIDGYGNRPAAPQPTRARPGTAEKFAILAARAEAGQELFRDDDAPVDLD